MGVPGLWNLAAPTATTVDLKTLRQKRLAVDASIWMFHFLKAMRDKDGNMIPGAHLIGFFRRICKLLWLQIWPVFVFDGPPPELKKKTLRHRLEQRQKGELNLKKVAERLVRQGIRDQALGKVPVRHGAETRAGDVADAIDASELLNEESSEDVEEILEVTEHLPKRRRRDLLHDFVGFLSNRRGLDDVTVPEAAGDKLRKVLLSMPGRREKPTSSEEWEEWKGYEVEDANGQKKTVRLPLGSFVDPELFDSLPPKTRYEMLRDLGDAWLTETRIKAVESKDDGDAFSNVQLEAFYRHIRTNKMMISAKRDMADKLPSDDPVGAESFPAVDLRRVLGYSPRHKDNKSAARGPKKRRRKEPLEFDGSAGPDLCFETNCPFTMLGITGGGTSSYTAPTPAAGTRTTADRDVAPRDSDDFGLLSPTMASGARGGSGDFGLLSPTMVSGARHGNDDFGLLSPTMASGVRRRNDDFGLLSPNNGVLSPTNCMDERHLDDEINGVRDKKDNDSIRNHTNNDGSAGRLGSIANANSDVELGFGFIVDDVEKDVDNAHVATGDGDKKADSAITALMAVDRTNFGKRFPIPPVVQCDADRASPSSPALSSSSVEVTNGHNRNPPARCNDDIKDEDSLASSGKESRSPPPSGARHDNVSVKREGEVDCDSVLENAGSVIFDDDTNAIITLKQSTDGAVENVDPEATVADSPAVGAVDADAQSSASGEVIVVTRPPPRKAVVLSDAMKEEIIAELRREEEKVLQDVTAENPLENKLSVTNLSGAEVQAVDAGKADVKVKMEDAYAEANGNAEAHAAEMRVGEPLIAKVQAAEAAKTDATVKMEAAYAELIAEAEAHAAEGVDDRPDVAEPDFGDFFPEGEVSLEEAVNLLLGKEDPNVKRDLMKAKRDMDVVTSDMTLEVKSLLRAFGIPYVEASQEAEAQCAKLVELGLCDGVVTDDSDILVFGAKLVYRHLFDSSAEKYGNDCVAAEFGLRKDHLICLAMLLGCDYTLGVKGIGIVNGLEVVDAWCVGHDDCLARLRAFRTWAEDTFNTVIDPNDPNVPVLYAEKHKALRPYWTFPDDFPSAEVWEAFKNPVVSHSTEAFTFGLIDSEKITHILERYVHKDQVERQLVPVVEKYHSNEAPIWAPAERIATIRSKRMQRAVDKMKQR